MKTKPRTITFIENGKDKISDYTDSRYSNDEIINLLHENSYRVNLVKALKEETNNKNLNDLSEISLGYAIDKVIKMKIRSTISDIKFHDLPLTNFGVKVK